MATSIPVVTIGKHAEIAVKVKESMLPEYEVIHSILSLSEALSILPTLLSGSPPSPLPSTNIGTGDYSRPVVAVITGGGYGDDEFAQIRKACEGKSNVPWMRPDMSVPTPPFGPAFAEALGGRVKALLKRLGEEGGMEGDGVFLF